MSSIQVALVDIYNTRWSTTFLRPSLLKKGEKEKGWRGEKGREKKEEEGKDLIYLSFREREVGRGSGSVVATTNYPTLQAFKRERKGGREGGGGGGSIEEGRAAE